MSVGARCCSFAVNSEGRIPTVSRCFFGTASRDMSVQQRDSVGRIWDVEDERKKNGDTKEMVIM